MDINDAINKLGWETVANDIIAHFSTRYFLSSTIRKALQMDPVDALSDLEVATAVVRAKLKNILGDSVRVKIDR